jgi:predicted phage terminase large subunit-like protein
MLLLWVSTALRPRRPPDKPPKEPPSTPRQVARFRYRQRRRRSAAATRPARRTGGPTIPASKRSTTANPAVTVWFDLPDNGKERKAPASGAELEPEAPQLQKRGPQPGQQERFLGSKADIAIYGGAAGGGKTWALLLQPTKHKAHADFSAVFFRRTTVQIRNPGGLWDESFKLYTGSGAQPFSAALEWRFPSGAKVRFAHLEHEKTVLEWQGAQAPLICFDELTHFTAAQFWSMTARNRSVGLVKPYIRATCNPDADSWVAELIAWWIDQETGFPIRSRNGKLRWFVRVDDHLQWADRSSDLRRRYKGLQPRSLTFIPAQLKDNRALAKSDPEYRARLMALPRVERERLLHGNWKIRPAAGLYFNRAWCQVVDAVPAGLAVKRGWDLAATPKTEANDPDWTVGVKLGRTPDGRYFVLDCRRLRGTPAAVERLLANTAAEDGESVEVALPQDPGQAGKAQAHALVRALEGFTVRATPESGDKVTRFGPFSAQAEAGNVYVLRAPWNEAWFAALESFPTAPTTTTPTPPAARSGRTRRG